MLSDVSPQLRGSLALRKVTVELLPLLLNIITPTLRPVSITEQFRTDIGVLPIWWGLSDIVTTLLIHFIFYLKVNMQLFSPAEKQQMLDLIHTMIAYNLTYHQERNVEGQYSYALDPYVPFYTLLVKY
jgi:chromosome transmission fidelity protein 18